MIRKIKLTDFRRFSSLELETNSPILIFSGPNATGKTSVLEAIYLTATSKSHRTNQMASLIKKQKDFATVEIETDRKFKVILSKEGKMNYINQIAYPKISDFIGNLLVILVSFEDLKLVSGIPSEHRKFLDLEASILDKKYLRECIQYRKILKERNEILKKFTAESEPLLNVVTGQLIEKITALYRKRTEFIRQINVFLKEITKQLECEEIFLEYRTTYDIQHLSESFTDKKAYDLSTKTTNIGLHRDDMKIYLNGQDISLYGSDGQKKVVVLAIKLALKKMVEVQTSVQPILLLDDVFAALDRKRIGKIMDYIQNEEQTFITTTSVLTIPDELLKSAKIITFEK